MESLWRDVRVAVRQLRQAPAFTLGAVLTLALGIGANTGIFSILNGLLRPLPVPDPARIVVFAADVASDESGVRYRVSYPALTDYRAQMREICSDIFGFDTRLGGLTTDGAASPFLYHYVTGNFFAALQLTPAAGRLLYPGEGERLGTEPVVVLGHAFWLRRFGGNPAVVGTLVRLEGQPVRVVGVAPQGFRGLFAGAEVDGYVPLSNVRFPQSVDRPFTDRSYFFLTMAGRLRPGVSLAAAQSVASTVAGRLSAQYTETEGGTGIRVMPEPAARPMPIRFFSLIFPVIKGLVFVLAALVLIVACLNVANLLLVRASIRQREMAVRSALGSGRVRLIRLLLVESLVLALLGTGLGLIVGQTAATALLSSLRLATDLSMELDVRFDWQLFAYAFGIAVVTSIVVGLVPAVRATSGDLTAVLHDSGRGGTTGRGGQRLRHGLVVVQVAGSLMLLLIAGVFVQNLRRAERADLGFDPDDVLTMRLHHSPVGATPARTKAFFEELEQRVAAMPGVQGVSFATIIPMTFGFNSCSIEPEGAAIASERLRPSVSYNAVGPDYFSTLRLPVVRGRAFDEHDRPETRQRTRPVALVNQTLAARLWPGQDPIGKRLHVFCAGEGPPVEIIGVARDSKYIAVYERTLPYLYLSIDRLQPSTRLLHIRATADHVELSVRVRQEAQRLDGDVQLTDVRSMRAAMSGGLGYMLFKFGAVQAAGMGLLGFALAIVGLYGVVAYGAHQRVREIGIRQALGATRGDIRRLILGHGATLVVTGAIIGLAAGSAMLALLGRFVELIGGAEPLTALGVMAVLVLVGLIASYLPAHRALRVDPISALRRE